MIIGIATYTTSIDSVKVRNFNGKVNLCCQSGFLFAGRDIFITLVSGHKPVWSLSYLIIPGLVSTRMLDISSNLTIT